MVSYATASVCKILVLFLIIVLPGIVYQYKRGPSHSEDPLLLLGDTVEGKTAFH